MDINFEKTGNVNAEITVTINKEDYADRVEKALKDYRKRASVPGFRPGQAPMSMLKKRFGNEVTAEEVNKVLGEKLYGYIREQKINILGEPLPNVEKTPEVNFETMESFTFVFDIALAPEFDAKLSKKDTVDYYTIQVTDEMVEQQVQMYASRGGEYQKVDEYQAKDMVKGTLTQLDENGEAKADGVVKEGAVMLPEYMKNDEQKALFNGVKVGGSIVLNPFKAYDGNEVELSSMLGIDKAEVANCQGDFKLDVTEITRFQPAALTQELFDQVLGKDAVKSEEEFRAAIKNSLQEQFKNDSQFKFMLDLRTYLTGRVGTLEYPEEMLKK
ncbi:MAG: trigger factor, partial [Bacteroidaceae bacterium]|nr:trigger factor [Bacteroidaceae bacterium]